MADRPGCPGRPVVPRWLAGLATLAAAAIIAGAGAWQQSVRASDDLVARGGALFQANCAACHGTRGEGGPAGGPDVVQGPALRDVELAYIDLTMRTGRMPIAEPSVGVRREQLDDTDREAVNAYVVEALGVTGTIPEVVAGNPARGQQWYVRNCAACHGAAGDGGISGANVQVPALVGVDDVAIAEATRVGPFEMPAFSPAVLDDDAIDDIVGYLGFVEATPRTYAGVRELDQIGAVLFSAGLGLAAAVVVLVVARARRWHPHEPGGLQHEEPFEPRDTP